MSPHCHLNLNGYERAVERGLAPLTRGTKKDKSRYTYTGTSEWATAQSLMSFTSPIHYLK